MPRLWETARAGEAGKGFAVVADEVRNLASKSAEASKNTSVLIEGSLKAVGNGSRIADETAESLETVVKGVKEVTETIEMITDASRRQSDSIRQRRAFRSVTDVKIISWKIPFSRGGAGFTGTRSR